MLAKLDEYFLPNYTYEDYKNWQGDWELIKGVPYAMSPAPSIEHQETNAKIIFELMSKLKNCPNCKVLPEVDYRIDKDTILRPDTLVVCNLKGSNEYLEQTPEIIFEVLSPSTKTKDRNLKFMLYAKAGVKYYILVDPKAKLSEVYILEDNNYKLKAELTDESFEFNTNECSFEFSFKEIFG